jgi:hypothetical protein
MRVDDAAGNICRPYLGDWGGGLGVRGAPGRRNGEGAAEDGRTAGGAGVCAGPAACDGRPAVSGAGAANASRRLLRPPCTLRTCASNHDTAI